MSEIREKTIEILGSDLNQSLHHLIGYWYATNTGDTFNSELACDMIEYCLKELSNPVSPEVKRLQVENARLKQAAEYGVELAESINEHAETCAIFIFDDRECNCFLKKVHELKTKIKELLNG